MADDDARIEEMHGIAVQYREKVDKIGEEVIGMKQLISDVKSSIDSLNSTLKWHTAIGAGIIGFLAWNAVETYRLNASVAGLEALKGLMQTIAEKLLAG